MANPKLFLAAASLAIAAYLPAQTAPLQFEVASIHLEDSTFLPPMVLTKFQPDGYTARNASLRLIIQDAYGVDDKQISGLSGWATSDRYNIDAKIDGETVDAFNKLPQQDRRLAQQYMLQSLLADRFGLTLHHEAKELPVYELVIAKNGAKLHEATPGDTYANGLKAPGGRLVGPHMGTMSLQGGSISTQGLPLDSFLKILEGETGLMVVNKTGLTGNYDFTLTWAPEPRPGMPANPDAAGPSLFTALEEQLGLKLQPVKAPVDTLIIDHLYQPSGN